MSGNDKAPAPAKDAITCELRPAGVVTQLISDRPHLFEAGGENYRIDFTVRDCQRAHEGDPWKTRADPSRMGAPDSFRPRTPYGNSRGYLRGKVSSLAGAQIEAELGDRLHAALKRLDTPDSQFARLGFA